MIRNYICRNTNCHHKFIKDTPIKGKTIFKNGKWIDYETKLEIKEDVFSCPICGSTTCLYVTGAPTTKFPIHDLTYASNKKRILDGIYHDASSVTKKRANALRDEMNHVNSNRKSE